MKMFQRCSQIMIASLACLLFTGCGAKEEAGNDDAKPKQPEGMFYESSVQELTIAADSIVGAELLGDDLFLIAGRKTEGGETEKRLYRISEGKTEEILPEGAEDSSVEGLGAAPDGSLRLVLRDREEPSGWELRTISADGGTLACTEITSVFEEPPVRGIMGLAVDGQGNTYLMMDREIKVFDGNGKYTFSVSDLFASDVTRTFEGHAAVILSKNKGMQIAGIDLQSRKLEETRTELGDIGGRVRFVRGSGEELLYYTRNKLYLCRGKEAGEEVLDFASQGVDGDSVAEIVLKENGDFVILTGRAVDGVSERELQAVTLRKADASQKPEKTVIVLGTEYATPAIQSAVADFNRDNDLYQMEIKQYAGENARDKLNMDIIAGEAPDILDLQSIESSDIYIEKGLLEDLRPWMEQDEEIGGRKYLDNILETYGRDGKLYGIIPSFSIDSMVAKRSIAGDRVSWTLDEMMEIAEGTAGLERILPAEFAKEIMILVFSVKTGLDRFVDWEKGECKFEGPEFMSLLEFVNRYAAEDVVKASDEEMDDRMAARYSDFRSGRLLLSNVWIQNIYDQVIWEYRYGEDICYVGTPVSDGCGSIVWPNLALGIMGGSGEKEKEGAWQFIRNFLLEEYQDRIGTDSGFPVLESALQKRYQEAMTPEYYEDDNGNQAERPKFMYNVSGTDDMLSVYALTQEQIDRLDALIRSLDRRRRSDSQIEDIIGEESAGYFAGAKTAGEAAGIIQNRVQLYMDENK